tara:strand:- start:251 stop:400 length:150 start_codon:yes stop_codon:yes gene_type:complete
MNNKIQKLEAKLKEIDAHYEQRIEVIKRNWSETYNDTVEAIILLRDNKL